MPYNILQKFKLGRFNSKESKIKEVLVVNSFIMHNP